MSLNTDYNCQHLKKTELNNKNKILEKLKSVDLMAFVNSVAPSFETVQKEIDELKKSYPNKSKKEIANIFGNRLRRKYTSIGIVSALPSAIPGIGTGVQLAVEASTISGDLALMLRWMAGTCYGIALINEKDIQTEFNQEFVKILGLWCGVIETAKVATERVATKVALAQFNRNVSEKVLQTINKRVGFTLFTKYGTKRGGIAIGKLIPFGVGALVGGSFNYMTMNKFKKEAMKYFQSNDNTEYTLYEEIEDGK